MILRRSILVVFSLEMGGMLYAQTAKDTVSLDAFEVTAPRQTLFGAGMKVQRLDSATLDRFRAASLADLLAKATPVFVKSYGLGGLATTSLRGGSANHTAVLWNGFNIGSPLNGQIDLSLVPVFATDEVSLQYGGSAALWGSGAVGGTIQLNSTPRFNEGVVVDAGLVFGSFGDRRQQARVRLGHERWAASIGFYNADARNDFEFVNTERMGERPRQGNARFAQYGVLAEVHGRLTQRQRISLRYWGQSSHREVPPTLVQEQSTARQEDVSDRLTAEWQRVGDRITWMARTAWFDEHLDWYASDTVSADLNRSRTSITEAEARIRPGEGHNLNIGLNHTWYEAMSDGYPDGSRQHRTSVYAAYRYDRKRWSTAISLRQEALERDPVPFTATLGGSCRIARRVELKANAAKVYRVPTLNDLYWRPGGNPDLRSEEGYSADLGIVWNGERGRWGWRSEVTGFDRRIDDWIIWLPGSTYWSPRNVLQVWSRGVESDSELRIRAGRTVLKLGLITDHVVSTNQRATSANDASVDKQLIYVPMYSGGARIGFERLGFSLNLVGNYTGYRYISTDNRDFIAPYTLVNASMGYRLRTKSHFTWSIFFQGNNLLDTDYQVMLNRPMPLRTYQAGVSMHFHRPQRTTRPAP